MYRYLALIWDPHRSEEARTSRAISALLTAHPGEWSIAHQGAGILVVHAGPRTYSPTAHRLHQSRGVILGTIFDRRQAGQTARPTVCFDEAETRSVVGSGGQHLVRRYWGSYVAILDEGTNHKRHVIRDPSGNLQCYHTRYRGVDVFFSHIEDCVRSFSMSFSINRDYLTRWLIFGGLQVPDCGLKDVHEVLGGERLTLSGGTGTRTFLWNPVEIASTPRLEKPEDAARELRSVVQNTIDAWASCYENITLTLSGGLDSSIVAGCLAQSRLNPRVTYLNFSADVGFDQERLYTPGLDEKLADKLRAMLGTGDERHFARLVADRWRTTLVERRRDPSLDLRRLWEAPLMTSPPLLFTNIELDDAKVELATGDGTQAFFSGQGGDSMFLATIQPLPAIDYAHSHVIGRDLWRHAAATAKLSKESLWRVLRMTISHGILRRPYQSPVNFLTHPTLVKEEPTTQLTEDDFSGPWSKLAYALPPGKQLHLSGITGPAFYDYVFHSERHADHIDPLHSQPICELMLQIPTYTVLTGGVSRGLARRAFADLLPDEIRRRQVKGTGDPFYQKLVRRNLGFIRERLLDGVLVTEGYLDRPKLIAYLAAEEPFLTVSASQILSYLSAEIWLQQWAELRQRAAA